MYVDQVVTATFTTVGLQSGKLTKISVVKIALRSVRPSKYKPN